MMEATSFGDERLRVSNSEHESYSVVRIAIDHGPGALLQVGLPAFLCACQCFWPLKLALYIT